MLKSRTFVAFHCATAVLGANESARKKCVSSNLGFWITQRRLAQESLGKLVCCVRRRVYALSCPLRLRGAGDSTSSRCQGRHLENEWFADYFGSSESSEASSEIASREHGHSQQSGSRAHQHEQCRTRASHDADGLAPFTRLNNAFSKKSENHCNMVAHRTPSGTTSFGFTRCCALRLRRNRASLTIHSHSRI